MPAALWEDGNINFKQDSLSCPSSTAEQNQRVEKIYTIRTSPSQLGGKTDFPLPTLASARCLPFSGGVYPLGFPDDRLCFAYHPIVEI